MAAKISIGAMAIAIIGVGCGVVRANVYGAFTQIAVTGEAAPGSGGTFSSFEPPVGDGPIYFQAQDSNGVSGIYGLGLSSPSVVADTTMAAPTGGNYSGFSSLAAGGIGAGFIANTTTGDQLVMTSNPGVLVVAQVGDSPSAGETFGSFQAVAMGGIGPSGEVITDIGVYQIGIYPPAALESTPLANFSTTPAGASGPFTSFESISLISPGAGNTIIPGKATFAYAIHGTAGGAEGIYYKGTSAVPGGIDVPALTVLADTATPSIQNFTSFGNPVVTLNNIAFTAHYGSSSGDQQGIFAYGPYYDNQLTPIVPALTQLVASGEVAPDSGGAHFASFLTVSGGSGAYQDVFTATLDDGQEGLYTYDWGATDGSGVLISPGTIDCILDTTDTFDGKSISDIELATEAATGFPPIPFKVDFTDGSQGLYYFSQGVPEPGSLGIALLGVTLLSRSRRTKPCLNHRPA